MLLFVYFIDDDRPNIALLFYLLIIFEVWRNHEYSNPFPNKPWFLRVCSTSLLKTLWEKEKLLVTSNFSFFHTVFYLFGELSPFLIKFKIVVCKLFQFGRAFFFSFGKGLTSTQSLLTQFKLREQQTVVSHPPLSSTHP